MLQGIRKNMRGILPVLCCFFFGSGYSQVADFTVNIVRGCKPLSVNFLDRSSPPPVSWSWDFGNGSVSGSRNPGTLYVNTGTYDVKLRVTFADGTVKEVTKQSYIQVYNPPVADFTATTTSGCVPFEGSFRSLSRPGDAPIDSFLWDFGTGETGWGEAPENMFLSVGKRSVTLIVRDTNGCSATYGKPDYITIHPKPSANFSSLNNTACRSPHTVNMTNYSLANASGTMSYQWAFSSGETSTAQNPSVSYTVPGIHDVRLIVRNSLGCLDTMLRPGYIDIQDLKVDFSVSDTLRCPPFRSEFKAIAPSGAGGRYEWTLSSGLRSQARDTVFDFKVPGNYSVKFLYAAPNGCRDSVIKMNFIKAMDAPVVSFQASDSLRCKPPLNVQFTSSGTNIASYSWDFGGGVSSTSANPSHTYTDTGYYAVSLIATAPNGCTDTFIKPSYIRLMGPKPFFGMSLSQGCAPLDVDFTLRTQSVMPVASSYYKFGDGQMSLNPTTYLSHTYKDTGFYRPKLIVTTVDGCTDSIAGDSAVSLYGRPVADFVADQLEGCKKELKVNYTNLTNGGSVKANAFQWRFGFGPLLGVEHPTILYDTLAGKKFDVELIAFNKTCSDTMLKTEYIHVLTPDARFSANLSGCEDSFSFVNLSTGTANKYYWDFGNEKIEEGETPPGRRFGYGTWNITMVAYDTITGCRDTVLGMVDVKKEALPKYKKVMVDNLTQNADSAKGCLDETHFYMEESGATNLLWEIESIDGSWKYNSRQQNMVINYPKPGYYNVTLSGILGECPRVNRVDSMIVWGPLIERTDLSKVCAPQEIELITGIKPFGAAIRSKKLTVSHFSFNEETGDTLYHEMEKELADTMRVNFDEMGYALFYDRRFDPPQPSTVFGWNVTYYVTDGAGCRVFIVDTVPVYRSENSYNLSRGVTCEGSRYFFERGKELSWSKGPYSYRWLFEDGAELETEDRLVEHTYTSSGDYIPRLITTDSAGCQDTFGIKLAVEVNNLRAGLTAVEREKPCPPFIVQFNDNSLASDNGINSWQWSFEDGTGGEIPDPVKVFTEPGKYGVGLKVTDTAGCTDSIYIPDYITVGGTRIGYTMDTLHGCDPFTIRVKSYSTGTEQVDIKWLMEEGSNIVDSSDFTYIYDRPGKFVPLAFISDPAGCQYSLPVSDTVHVLESPLADFDYVPVCYGGITPFENKTHVVGTGIRYKWLFEEGSSSEQPAPSYEFPQGGAYDVSLWAGNLEGCGSEIKKEVIVPYVSGKVEMDVERVCAGSSLNMRLKSDGIGSSVWNRWIFGDGRSEYTQDTVVNYVYAVRGIYFPRVIVENEYGCRDTTVVLDSVIVGADFSPEIPVMYRSTVLDDTRVRTVFERDRTIDYEKYLVYRENALGVFDLVGELSDRDDTVFTDIGLNTLRNSYRYLVQTKNFCGYYSVLDGSKAHRTINIKAETSDDAAYLSWNAYEGWPVSQYEIYRENGAGDYILHKLVNGSDTQTWDSSIVCHRSYLYKVRAAGPDEERYSASDTSGALPRYIPYVASNELLSASVEGKHAIEVKWKEPQGGKAPVSYYLLERSADGIAYQAVHAPFASDVFSYEDHLDGVTEYPFYYRVIVQDSCGYYSLPSNYGKTIISRVSLNAEELPQIAWSAYEEWPEGVEHYYIELLDEGTFIPLGQVDGSRLSFTDAYTSVNSRGDYCYRITAYSSESGGKYSRSNIVCAPVVSRLFVPNAFRPDGRPDNQVFRAKGMYVERFSMKILDRWGAELFSTDSIDEGWDGTFRGKPLPGGAYVYLIEYVGAEGAKKTERGTFILMR
jgi:gliding motility-associated-like protein